MIKLHAVDEDSDLDLGAVCDEIWNALGRPAHSADYTMIVGSGIAEWKNGDPARQHHKMRILATNIRTATHAKLQDRKEQWATRIEQRATAQEQAATPLEAAEALASALRSQRRGLANHAQTGLSRLKRDYKNAGMTEIQLHEITPDHERPKDPRLWRLSRASTARSALSAASSRCRPGFCARSSPGSQE